MYNQVVRPAWTYGVQIRGCGIKNHIDKIQAFQNKVLCKITNAPKHVRTTDLHRDLGVEMVNDIIEKLAVVSHENRLKQHINEETSRLMVSRIKRTS